MRFNHRNKQIRRSTETTDKKLAQKIYAKVLTQLAEGKWLDIEEEQETTFAELLEKYLREHSIKKAPRSLIRDKASSKHLFPFFGSYLLEEITPKLISEYKSKRYIAGAKPATINRELALMKHSFTLATMEWELAKDNPVKRVSMEKENNARDRWLEDYEEELLLPASPLWLQEIIIFALNTGMRLEEILSLKWRQVDCKRAVVIILHSKNGERRTIPLNKTLIKFLNSKVRYLNSSYVFTTSVGTKIDQGNLRRAFGKARKTAEVEDFRFHDLRHTFATRLVQSGVDLYKIQKLLGHKTPLMTQRYAHHYTESLRDGVEVLDELETSKKSIILAQSAISA